MEYPKLAIFSDGESTAVLLDGVLFGVGIGRVDLSATCGKVVVSLTDIDVSHVRVDKNPDLRKLLNQTEE